MTDLSKISVVLPSLDPDEKLTAVIEGLLEYGFTDIILVNDGSKPENLHWFEEAAAQNSSCPSSRNGGSLGEFGRGQMVPEFDTACFEMEVGELRGPVQTQFGYHLIRLDDKKTTEKLAFSDVREELVRQLTAEKQKAAYRSKLNQLKILYPVDRF